MGRHAKPSANLFVKLFRLGALLLILFGVIYGTSYGIFKLSTVTVGDVYSKTSPVSTVAEKYIDKTPISGIADKLVEVNKDTLGKSKELPILTLALMGDSHSDNSQLEKALARAKKEQVDYVIFLGDYTDLGTIPDLQSAKKIMDASGLEYYSVPGDHDLWKSVGPANFLSIFEKRYDIMTLKSVNFLLLDNSNNTQGVDAEQLKWFSDKLDSISEDKSLFIVMSNPLYNSSNFKVMGENNENVRQQAQIILGLIRNSPAKAVISGDNHLSSRSKDPVKAQLEHVVVGALTVERNLQTPRFSIMKVYENTYEITEVVL